jgi:hypothetical protein
LGEIVRVIEEAENHGLNGRQAAREMFPTAPDIVITEAWLEWEYAQTEAWWQSVERTIEGQVLRRAIISTPPAEAQERPEPPPSLWDNDMHFDSDIPF